MLVIQSVGTALHMDVATTLCLVVRFNCKAFHSHLFCFIKLPQHGGLLSCMWPISEVSCGDTNF